jgi:hypothetical protein
MRCRPQSMTARRFEAEGSASYPLRERGVDCRGRGSGPVAPRPRLIDGIRPDTNKLLRAVRPPLYREGVKISPRRTTVVARQQEVSDRTPRFVSASDVSEGVARRRRTSRVPEMCPECVRVFLKQTTTKCQFAGTFTKPSDGLEPSTPSLPWRFWRVTRVHARSLTTRFFLQIRPFDEVAMRRETSRVSFLMCPFYVRVVLLMLTTNLRSRHR